MKMTSSQQFHRWIGFKFFARCLFAAAITLACSTNLQAYKVIEEIAFTVEGFEIPIQITVPEKGEGPFPVVYHVHGGGWNGGTATTVPGASTAYDARMLSDELGIIFVGLAYRCKLQGNFQEAMDDLRQSIRWFETQANRFNADTSRVGLSGGSAGTTLSALLAQGMPECKTYVGYFGVYDLLNNEESLFPNEEARVEYNLNLIETQRAASAFHNLRKQPPATLLFHGAKDILTHPTQSIRFAEKLKANGAMAEAIIYPDANHGYYTPVNPPEFRDSTLRIGALYAEHLTQRPWDSSALEARLDEMLAPYHPLKSVSAQSIIGDWESKIEKLSFTPDGSGTFTNRKKNEIPFSYTIQEGSIFVTLNGEVIEYFMQNDQRAIYMIFPEGRFAGRKDHFYRK